MGVATTELPEEEESQTNQYISAERRNIVRRKKKKIQNTKTTSQNISTGSENSELRKLKRVKLPKLSSTLYNWSNIKKPETTSMRKQSKQSKSLTLPQKTENVDFSEFDSQFGEAVPESPGKAVLNSPIFTRLSHLYFYGGDNIRVHKLY